MLCSCRVGWLVSWLALEGRRGPGKKVPYVQKLVLFIMSFNDSFTIFALCYQALDLSHFEKLRPIDSKYCFRLSGVTTIITACLSSHHRGIWFLF